jgi:hypothetical protein
MKVVPLASNVLGVDTLTTLAAYDCHALVTMNMKWRGGYIETLSPQEISSQLGAGLPLLPYTEANDLDLARTLNNIARLGLPAGSNLVLDIEGVIIEPADLISRIITWGNGLASRAFLPCAYIGAQAILTAHEWSMLPVYRYHAGASQLRDRNGAIVEPDRGYAMIQGRPCNVALPTGNGNTKVFDVDFHRFDYRDDGFSVIASDS